MIQTKFVVVVGGVISGVGKGVTTASLGKIIQEYGYRTTLIKVDPYLNYDAGTMRPTMHGEVWVTKDGGEIDQDLGTYERFMDLDIPKHNNITTGQIYKTVIDRERRGEYDGQDVKFIPHIPDEIIRRIKLAADGYEVAIIEIGGTVGDYENKPFLFAVRALERQLGKGHVAYVLVVYLPVPEHIGEMKTKPAQQAVKLLNEEGISPDFIVCRSKYAIDDQRKRIIELYANVESDCVIAAPDIETIYQIPLDLEDAGIGKKVLSRIGLEPKREPDWSRWQQLVNVIKAPKETLRVAIVGKYLATGDYTLVDSYVSIQQALIHACAANELGLSISWIDASALQTLDGCAQGLEVYDGIIVPGGFGQTGVEGKINTIACARKKNIPYLGLCYGMQLAAVEFARNVCGLQGAHTTEVDPETLYPIIDILAVQKQLLEQGNFGGSMRLGAYKATLKKGSAVYAWYNQAQWLGEDATVAERHRHRYEVNPLFVPVLEKAGLVFSGYHERVDGTKLMEFLELPNHPFFIATQAHPEFTSRFGKPNPLFHGFVMACKKRKDTLAQASCGVDVNPALFQAAVPLETLAS